MKRLLIISSGFFFINFNASSQDLEYKAVSDDPGKAVSKLYLGIEPMFIDLNGTNGFAMGWGLYAHYHIKQDLMFQARFQTPYYKGYLDGAYLSVDQKDKASLFNDYKPQKLIYADFTVSKKILRMDRPNKAVNIPLGNGGDLYNYIDGARAIKRYQVMARGGLLIRNSTVPLTNTTLPKEVTWSTGKPYANMKSASIYAGVSLNKMWELVANITELDIGEKIARMHKSVYFDAMFAPQMSFKDLEKGGVLVPVTDDVLGKNRIGFRLGVANMPEYKNNLTGWELGVFPSFKKTGSDKGISGGFFKFWMIIDVYSSKKS